MSLPRAILVPAVLALASCGTSPTTHYFTLTADSGPAHERVETKTPVTVAAVHLPSSLDRSEMVRRTANNAVAISDQDRWAAPLGEMTRRVLSQDLAARLPPQSVILPDAPSPPNTAQIVVTLDQFGPDPGGECRLSGSWTLVEAKSGTPRLRRDVALATKTAANDGSGEADGMSRLLAQLATQIAEGLQDRS